MEEVMTPSEILVRGCGGLRGIMFWPVKILCLIVGVPNYKIVYKSRHVETYFFLNLNIKRNGGEIKEIEWLVPTQKQPFHVNVNEIETIVRLY
jgi:hypothetical protein